MSATWRQERVPRGGCWGRACAGRTEHDLKCVPALAEGALGVEYVAPAPLRRRHRVPCAVPGCVCRVAEYTRVCTFVCTYHRVGPPVPVTARHVEA